MGTHPQEPRVHAPQKVHTYTHTHTAQLTIALFILKRRNNPNVHQHSDRSIICDPFIQRNATEEDEGLPLPCYMDESHGLLLEKSQIQWFYLYEVNK